MYIRDIKKFEYIYLNRILDNKDIREESIKDKQKIKTEENVAYTKLILSVFSLAIQPWRDQTFVFHEPLA